MPGPGPGCSPPRDHRPAADPAPTGGSARSSYGCGPLTALFARTSTARTPTARTATAGRPPRAAPGTRPAPQHHDQAIERDQTGRTPATRPTPTTPNRRSAPATARVRTRGSRRESGRHLHRTQPEHAPAIGRPVTPPFPCPASRHPVPHGIGRIAPGPAAGRRSRGVSPAGRAAPVPTRGPARPVGRGRGARLTIVRLTCVLAVSGLTTSRRAISSWERPMPKAGRARTRRAGRGPAETSWRNGTGHHEDRQRERRRPGQAGPAPRFPAGRRQPSLPDRAEAVPRPRRRSVLHARNAGRHRTRAASAHPVTGRTPDGAAVGRATAVAGGTAGSPGRDTVGVLG